MSERDNVERKVNTDETMVVDGDDDDKLEIRQLVLQWERRVLEQQVEAILGSWRCRKSPKHRLERCDNEAEQLAVLE